MRDKSSSSFLLVALGDASRDDQLLSLRLSLGDDGVHRALARILHGARVHHPHIRVVRVGDEVVAVRAELPGHELGVRVVVRAIRTS